MLSQVTRRLIDEAAAGVDQDLIGLRRAIHVQPELAGREKRTAALVAEQLEAVGLDVSTRVGGYGVVGVLDGDGAGPTIAYRADMDAVAMDEKFQCEFRSRVPGVGHLCGHDIHTAVGVGVARVLAHMRDELNGRVVFYFQPAEEALTGAQAMIDDGIVERTGPHEIYALHCAPFEVGSFAVMPGVGVPGHDNFDLELDGMDAAERAEAIAAGVSAWSTVKVPSSPQEYQRLLADVQVEDGPLARFVFAGARTRVEKDALRAYVRGWVKAWPDDVYPNYRDHLAQLVREICGPQALNQLKFPETTFPAMVCSPELSHAAAQYLRAAFTPDAVTVMRACFPFNGEDFALFLNRIPGAMFFLGVANPAAGLSGRVHTPGFGADERAIGIGTRAMAGWLVYRLAALAVP